MKTKKEQDNIKFDKQFELKELQEETVYQSIRNTLINAQNNIARTVNSEMVNAYWNIGKYIYEAQGRKERAEYGSYLIKYLSERLTKEFGKGFSERSLKDMRQFYNTFLCSQFEIGHTLCAQSQDCPNALLKLSWSHIRLIMRLLTEEKRIFYVRECAECNWSVRQLERQIHSFYYERLLASHNKDIVRNEIQTLEPNNMKPIDILKDPYVLEFLNMRENKDYLESDLESEIMNNLQKFILELGRGFAFVGRQYRISLNDGKNYYVDLVFYNIELRCYVLIDLKTTELDHRDIGQMDFYVRYFEEEIKKEDDNPTIGIILCAEKSKSMVKYTALNNSKQLFASKYSLYLPTEEELTNYIKKERELLERKYIGISEEYEEKDINNNKSIKGAKNETTKKSKSK